MLVQLSIATAYLNFSYGRRGEMMGKTVRALILLIFELLLVWTLFLIFGLHNVFHALTTKQLPLDNAGFFIIGRSLVTVLFLSNIRWGEKIGNFLKGHVRLVLAFFLALLLLWQLYSCYGGYFISGWDAGIIRRTVSLENSGNYDQIDNNYFSWCPNNLLLVWVFKSVSTVAAFFGFLNWEYALVAFQCVIDACAIWLVYEVTFEFSNNVKVAFFAFFSAILFIGLSPWFIVAYSDATGFLFPILIIRIYQLENKTSNRVIKVVLGVLLGIVSCIAYHIKPHILIVCVAIVLIEACSILNSHFKQLFPEYLKRIGCYFIGHILFIVAFNNLILPTLHIQINPDTTIGWQHYFMMGLNRDRDGVYSDEDFAFTRSFSTNEERNKADIQEAVKRIRHMGKSGLFIHLNRKQLVNYGDGTFAWNVEGGSFSGDPDWAQNRISNLVRSFIKPGGRFYQWFVGSKQLMWIMVLFFQLFVFMYPRKELTGKQEKTVMVLVTSVIGISIFELLMEARARYLFCFSPLYVVLFGWGIRNIYLAEKTVYIDLRNQFMRRKSGVI